MDETQRLLQAWRASPDSGRSTALCRALAASPQGPGVRPILAEIAPQIASRLAADVTLQLLLARTCIDAGDMFLADNVLKPLLRSAPSEPKVWKMLGEVFLRAGNARDAGTAFEGAVARGASDDDTLRWREKARDCKPLQEAGGHGVVAVEIARWLTAPDPLESLEEPDPSDMTIVREPNASDLAAVAGQAPAPRILGHDSRSMRAVPPPLAPADQEAADDAAFDLDALAPGHPNRPPASGLPAVLGPPPAAAAPPAAPPPAAAPPAAEVVMELGESAIIDEQSLHVDVTKLPEGAKLDEVLEALREGAGLVIEEPTGFYQAPVRLLPEDSAPAHAAPSGPALGGTVMMPTGMGAMHTPTLTPQGMAAVAPPHNAAERALPARPNPPAAMRTMMMPTAADLTTEPQPAAAPPTPASPIARIPPPPALSPTPPVAQATAPMPGGAQQPGRGSVPSVVIGGARPVESPSGVIINSAMAGPALLSDSSASLGEAPTVRGDSLLIPQPQLPPAGYPPSPMPMGGLELGPSGLVGAGPQAVVAASKPKRGGAGVWIFVLALVAALAAAGWYLVKVRGLIPLG